MLRLKYRKRLRLPRNLVTINISGLRRPSATLRLWRLSRNSRRPGVTRINLPGGLFGEWTKR